MVSMKTVIKACYDAVDAIVNFIGQRGYLGRKDVRDEVWAYAEAAKDMIRSFRVVELKIATVVMFAYAAFGLLLVKTKGAVSSEVLKDLVAFAYELTDKIAAFVETDPGRVARRPWIKYFSSK